MILSLDYTQQNYREVFELFSILFLLRCHFIKITPTDIKGIFNKKLYEDIFKLLITKKTLKRVLFNII